MAKEAVLFEFLSARRKACVMKTIRSIPGWRSLLALPLFVFMFGGRTFAQTSNDGSSVPTVTIQATDPIATIYQPTNPGAFSYPIFFGNFTVFRQGNTNETLNVYYQIGGTATNGVDYTSISSWVSIPAGAVSNSIYILPIVTSGQTNMQMVFLQLAPSPLMSPIPVNYLIGVPSNAVVYIGRTNALPMPDLPSGISSPANGAVFYTPTNIQIFASLFHGSPYSSPPLATNMEFFAGTNDLGKGVQLGGPMFAQNFLLTWTNPPPGDYALTAVVTGYGGNAIIPVPVNVTIMQGLPPNHPPVVNIIDPKSGDVFYTPTNVQILAQAVDQDGFITNVEFFAGTADLGKGLPVVLDPPGMNGVTGLVYLLNWQNVPANKYLLTAVTTDNGGLSTTSAPVNIAVLARTNLPPVVRITSPPNGAVFRAPVQIPLYAYAADPDGFVATVEFFAGSTSLGFGRPVTVVPSPLPPGPLQPPILIVVPTNYWELVCTNPPLGTSLALTAEATDNGGASTVSTPVFISVLPPAVPPTNRPPIVSIVANDPVAIEGTNCCVWAGETNATPTWAAWPTAIRRPFTNCGPKNASFTVRRYGATNGDLTVTYVVGGSASNGVDYVALPGQATIPAGNAAAMITLVPIDDGPPDVNKTVILALTPATNMPPDYLLGFPRRAAAIIIDNNGPRAGNRG